MARGMVYSQVVDLKPKGPSGKSRPHSTACTAIPMAYSFLNTWPLLGNV